MPNSFYEATITLITKPYKDSTKKTTEQYIKTGGKITNKIFANQIQEHIKTIIYNDQKGFIPEVQEWINKCKLINIKHHIKRLKDKNYTIILVDIEKTLDKIQHPFMKKS